MAIPSYGEAWMCDLYSVWLFAHVKICAFLTIRNGEKGPGSVPSRKSMVFEVMRIQIKIWHLLTVTS